ncbi:MBL fold metallo-hydrolase [Halobacillus andaensis]|uniref:MBL fold metallo-hydrolase n=1 Tax=Halobacillus andaensis TaxID=1176239 RepID=A0A917B0T5_HALAA|nr:MBL fold metallo-hydrolase [Halobacillus andaensis]MBP2004030.1 glyoxylase-like metal-dependent hydrolase (beta-lactamase superfamily II) [Halobacillus andaensis]GGF15263.1 MBL fold metallo-hydrolase [Halobacillus andaensis]
MSFHQINDHCYYYESAVNIGYVTDGRTGLLIDSGIDRSSVKKVEKELRKRELPLTHLFISHAHADHYGGAAYLQDNYDLYTFAPAFEAAILQNPSLEPLYLFGGNDPLPELRNKFLEGPAMNVDELVEEGEFTIGTIPVKSISTPGHSYNQLSLVINDTLYAADAYFSVDQLKKHKIPYITDAHETIESLKKLLDVSCSGGLPGHGTYEKDFKATVQANIDYHERLFVWLEANVKEAITHETIVAKMCCEFEVQAPQLSQWLLYRTAVTAYLVGLIKRKKITHKVSDFCWTFYRVGCS